MSELSIAAGTTDEIVHDALEVRRTVFIEGQGVPEERELDGLDGDARHYVGYIDDKPVAVARTRRVHMDIDTIGRHDLKIERVGVLPVYRSHGLGRQVMRFILAELPEQPLVRNAILESQTHALGFYKDLGFSPTGRVFQDAGMPHRKMLKSVHPIEF